MEERVFICESLINRIFYFAKLKYDCVYETCTELDHHAFDS